MFGLVRESRLREAERQAAQARADRARSNNEWRNAMNAQIETLRHELAQTWIRNARGHFQRHPSAGK